ncbi:Hypothetical protein D9617_4g000830 [Elsinoe fawcettii]|nr:Hypothetical protein D9617_4g000830 [Elsinoe fawcettii]
MDALLQHHAHFGLYLSATDSLMLNPIAAPEFPRHLDVVYVCVHVERNPNNPQDILEASIATFDTRDIEGVAPCQDQAGWTYHITSRHIICGSTNNPLLQQNEIRPNTRINIAQTTVRPRAQVRHTIEQALTQPLALFHNDSNFRNVIYVCFDLSEQQALLWYLGVGQMRGTINTANIVGIFDLQAFASRAQSPASLEQILTALPILIEPNDLASAADRAVMVLQALIRMVYMDAFDAITVRSWLHRCLHASGGDEPAVGAGAQEGDPEGNQGAGQDDAVGEVGSD